MEECETGLSEYDIYSRRAIDFTGFQSGIGCGLHVGTVSARTNEYHENPTHTVNYQKTKGELPCEQGEAAALEP